MQSDPDLRPSADRAPRTALERLKRVRDDLERRTPRRRDHAALLQAVRETLAKYDGER